MARQARNIKIAAWLGGTAAGFGAVIYLLPALLSGPGLPWLVSTIDEAIPGAIEIDHLALSWGGPQRLEGLKLYDPDGGEVLAVPSIEADQSLWSLLSAPHCTGTITISGVDGRLIALPGDTNNLQRALSRPAIDSRAKDSPSSPPPVFPADMRCRLDISDGRLMIETAVSAALKIETISLTGLTGHVQVNGIQKIEGALTALLSQGESNGRIEAKLTAADLLDGSGKLDFAAANLAAEAAISAMPVAMIAALAGGLGPLTVLLGGELDGEVRAEYQNGRGQARLALTASGGGEAAIAVEMIGDRLTVAHNSRVELTITPESWQTLAGRETILTKPFVARIQIPEMTLPLADPGKAAFKLHAALSDVEMQAAQAGKLALRGTDIEVASGALSEALAVTFATTAEQSGRRGTANIKADVRQWLDEHLSLTAEGMQIDVDGRISDLPLAVFDELFRQDGLLVAALGESLSADMHSKIADGGRSGTFAVQATSRHLEVSLGGEMNAGGLLLKPGGKVALNVQPAAVQRLAGGVRLSAPARILLTIEQLSLPRRESGFSWDDAAFTAGIQSAELNLRFGDQMGVTRIQGLRTKVQTARLAEAFGMAFAGQINGGAVNSALSLKELHLSDGFSLGQGNVLTFDAQPAALAPFLPDDLRPASDLSAEIKINRLQWPAAGPAAGSVDLTASIAPLKLAGAAAGTALDDTTLQLTAADIGRQMNVALSSMLKRGTERGEVALNAEVSGWPATTAIRRATLTARNMPAAIAAALAGQSTEFAGLFGDRLNAEGSVVQGAGAARDFTLEVDAQRLTAKVKGRMDERQWVIDKDAVATLNLTPEAAGALLPAQWRLRQPANVQLTLQKFAVALDPKNGADYRTLQLDATFKAPELTLGRADSAAEFPLRNMLLAVNSARLAQGATLDIGAALPAAPGSTTNDPAGRLNGKIAVRNALDRNGDFDLANAVVTADIRAERIASASVLALAGQDKALSEALGPAISAQFTGAIPGDFTVGLAGRNTRLAVAGNIDDGHTLRLNDDAVFELNVTPPLVDAYLSKMHPFLREVSSSEKPIRLTVERAGFALPLTAYRPKAINARGRVEIGTLLMHRGPITGALTSALQVMGGQVVNRQNFPARFTPLAFSVEGGVIRTNDLWMEMDNVLLGSQARLYLPESREGALFAEVLFAVPGKTLQMLPKISQQIPADQLFEVADSGPIDQLSPDFSKLFAGVVAQSAGSALASAAGRPELGAVIGLFSRAARQKPAAKKADSTVIEGWVGATWPNMPPLAAEPTG